MAPIWRIALAYVAYYTAAGAGFPYLPIYYRNLGLDLGVIGGLAALSAATQLVAAPVWGALADRFAMSRLTLPGAALIAVVGGLVLADAHELIEILLGAFILAAGLSGVGPVLDARAIETLGPDRARYGQIRALGSVTFVVISVVVGILMDRLGDRALFLVYVPALLLTASIATSFHRRATTRAIGIAKGAMTLVHRPGVGLFLLGTFLVWTSLNAVTSFYSIRVTALGGRDELVGLSWAVGASIEAPIMWYYARIARRWGVRRPIVLGAVMFALRAAAAAGATQPWMLVAISPAEGLAFGLFFVGGVMFIAERAPAGLTATAQGVYTAVAGLASIVGAAFGGIIAAQLTIPGLFAVCAVLGAIAAVVVAIAVGRATLPVPDGAESLSPGFASAEAP